MGSGTLGSRAVLSSGNVISYVSHVFSLQKICFILFLYPPKFRLYRGNLSVAQETLINYCCGGSSHF